MNVLARGDRGQCRTVRLAEARALSQGNMAVSPRNIRGHDASERALRPILRGVEDTRSHLTERT